MKHYRESSEWRAVVHHRIIADSRGLLTPDSHITPLFVLFHYPDYQYDADAAPSG